MSPTSPKEKGASSSQGIRASTPRKKQRIGDVEEETPSEVQKLSERQPATSRKRGKKLDFHIENEEQHAPIKLNLVPSQDLKRE